VTTNMVMIILNATQSESRDGTVAAGTSQVGSNTVKYKYKAY